MDRDSAEKEVARRIARANDDLRAELDVDEGKVTQSMTPLHQAVQAGSVEQVQALLDRFAVRVRCVLQQDGDTLSFSASMGLQSMPRMCGKWAFPI